MSHDAHGKTNAHGSGGGGVRVPNLLSLLRQHIRVAIPTFLVLIVLTIYWAPAVAAFVFTAIAFLSPFWLPALLVYFAWPLWLTFARSYFIAGIPYVTIELKPGPETPRTAKPMELALYSLYHRIDISKRDFLLGRARSPWSFEAYVTNGTTRFFVHVPESHAAAIEARIRAEYRDIETEPVRDYSREIPFHPGSMRVFSREFSLSKPDPYPLRTYESYESLEPKRDLFAEMLEELSLVGKNEHILISYIIRPHQRERTSYFEEPRDTLHEDAYRVIGAIVGSKGELHALPTSKQKVVAAIEASLKKPSFDCGIRALYVAEKSDYRPDIEDKLAHMFQRFDDAELNGFAAHDPIQQTGFFRSEMASLSSAFKADLLMTLFRRRTFFTPPYIGKAFILNTEELATVFHLPQAGRGGVASIRSTVRLEPPENLPV